MPERYIQNQTEKTSYPAVPLSSSEDLEPAPPWTMRPPTRPRLSFTAKVLRQDALMTVIRLPHLAQEISHDTVRCVLTETSIRNVHTIDVS